MDNYPSLLSVPSLHDTLVLARYPGILFVVLEILDNLLLWRFFLPACIMVDSICLSILHWHPLSLPYRCYGNHHVCGCTKSSIDPCEFILPAQTSFLNMSLFSTNQLPSIVPLSLLNLSILGQSVCFWSFVLEIIIPLLSKHQIIPLSYNMMPVHSFFLWLSTDTHISSIVDRPIHCWILPDNALHIQ